MSEFSMDNTSDDSFTRNPVYGHETLMGLVVKVEIDPVRPKVLHVSVPYAILSLITLDILTP
jgi:hypothetical protein